MTRHTPVLLHESVDSLALEAGDVFLDGTVGGGGHSSLVAERFGSSVKIIGLDRDIEAVKIAGERLKSLSDNFHLASESFRNLDKVLEDLGIEKVNAILIDLGISSDQIESSGRGFTFLKDEPLLMTMKKDPGEEDMTASMILNTFDEDSLELILRGFGEEKYSRRISRAIVARRKEELFKTTLELVDTILEAVPSSYKTGRIHPATRTFQALRIAVNEELTALEDGLSKGFEALASDGRFAIITFHSLEDRLVKNFFRDRAKEGRAELMNKKPITPSDEELETNKRSRSAKLRVIRKI